jgi:hypothetical protein
MFSSPLKRTLHFLGIYLVMFENQKHLVTSSFIGSFVLGVCSKVSKLKSTFVV